MSQPDPADGPPAEREEVDTAPPTRPQPFWADWPGASRRWLVAGTFVGGLVVGVLVTGLLADTSPVYAQEPPAVAATGGSPGVGLDDALSSGADRAVVNQACLRALNVAQDALLAGEDLGVAAAALDPAQLDEAVGRLQPLQSRLDEDLAACRVVEVDEGEGATPTGSTGAQTGAPTGSAATPTG